MEMSEKEKKDLSVYVVPEVPKLAEEKVELFGWQKYLHDWKIGKIERKELEEKRKIFADTRIQLLRDRSKEVIEAYRIHATAARETIIGAAEDYVTWFFRETRIKMTADRQRATNQAIQNYHLAVKEINPDWPGNLKELSIEKNRELLDQVIDSIMLEEVFKMEEALKKNYPEKKGFLDRFKS